MEPLFDVIRVEPQKDHTLHLVFENHEHRLFDMTPYLEKKPYTPLKHVPIFLKARVAYGTVVWPGNIDIAPETLWDHSIHIEQVATQEPQLAHTLIPFSPIW